MFIPNEEIIKMCKEIRENKGWSQNDLASYMGTTQGSICRWERGQRSPRTKLSQNRLINLWKEITNI